MRCYAFLAVEDLEIRNMLRRANPVADPAKPGQFLPNGAAAKRGLNRSIADASWGQFVSILRSKGEDAGRVLVDVDPPHTSTKSRPQLTHTALMPSSRAPRYVSCAGVPLFAHELYHRRPDALCRSRFTHGRRGGNWAVLELVSNPLPRVAGCNWIPSVASGLSWGLAR